MGSSSAIISAIDREPKLIADSVDQARPLDGEFVILQEAMDSVELQF